MLSIVGILLITLGLGGTAISVMESGSMDMIDFISIGYNLLPSVLFFTSLAALALGWAPGLGKIVYVYLSYSFLLSYFAGVLDFPEWFLKTVPQSWLAKMPIEDFDINIFSIITIISILLIIIGYWGYSKRDMGEGA